MTGAYLKILHIQIAMAEKVIRVKSGKIRLCNSQYCRYKKDKYVLTLDIYNDELN